MTLEEFRALYPEFDTGTDDLVELKLAEATDQIDSEVWGDLTERGIGLLTAHLLAIAPFGAFSRLQTAKGETTYGNEIAKLERMVSCGLRVF